VVIDANVTNDATPPKADEPRVEPTAAPGPHPQPWMRSLPTPTVTREQADKVGRWLLRAGTSGLRLVSGIAQAGAQAVRYLLRVIAAVPATLRLLSLAGILMLLGIVGAIALHNSLGLACIVVVVPVCSIALGALGHRWFSTLGEPAQRDENPVQTGTFTDLQRSVEYIDKKLTFALTAFGTERQQHAMIALFQAKTAVELTLGTEQDPESRLDALLCIDEHNARPRIRAGSAPKSLRESNSLAAS